MCVCVCVCVYACVRACVRARAARHACCRVCGSLSWRKNSGFCSMVAICGLLCIICCAIGFCHTAGRAQIHQHLRVKPARDCPRERGEGEKEEGREGGREGEIERAHD